MIRDPEFGIVRIKSVTCPAVNATRHKRRRIPVPLARLYGLGIRPAEVAAETNLTSAYIHYLLSNVKRSPEARIRVASAVSAILGRTVNVSSIWSDSTTSQPKRKAS